MAAFTSIAIGVAAAAGVAGTVIGINQQKKAAAKQTAALQKQEEAAREAAKKQTTREDTGAKVKLGTDDPNYGRSGSGANNSAANRSGAAGVGGLSASKRLGL